MAYLRIKGVLWTLVALLIFFIISAARSGVADLLSKQASDEISSWSLTEVQSDSVIINEISHLIQLASLISPGNPDYYENQVRLSLARADMKGVTASVRNDLLTQSEAQIRNAISLRPVSSYSWATLLILKRERAEYDAEFLQALDLAVTLGPWEPSVQAIVADVGLNAWAALPKSGQEMIRQNFVRGMKRQSEKMIAIVQSHLNDCNSERARLNAGCPR
jgi:hypothetical protein